MRTLASLSILILTLSAASAATDASKLFDQAGPSVVLIKNEEGIGSGVLIRQDGLVLTNFHVANTPLPLTVEAEVMELGKRVRKEFKDIKLHRIHKNCDLALLQLPANGVQFAVAKLSKSEGDAKPGINCYALGYPYVPGQSKPELVITKGIINSVSRTVVGQKYLQLDAAINPGNSGGALLNDKGILLGIPTLRFDGAEKVGLATPVYGMRMDDFIDLKDRKGNLEEAERLSAAATQYIMRDALTLGSDPEALLAALILLREAQFLDPSNPQRAVDLCRLYTQAQEPKIARAYAEQAVKLGPKNLTAVVLLSSICVNSGENELATKGFLSGIAALKDDPDPKQRELFFKSAVPHFSKHGEAIRALYLLAWWRSESGNQGGVEMDMILNRITPTLPEKVVQSILDKKSDFSLAELDQLAKTYPPDPKVASRKPVGPADVSTVKEATLEDVVMRSPVLMEEGFSAKLVDPPEGVTYDPITGIAEWRRPAFLSRKEVRLLFLLSREDGTEETKIHVMRRD